MNFQIILISFFILFHNFQAEELINFKQQMEVRVKNLALEFLDEFSRYGDTQCTTKSYNECVGTSLTKCYTNYDTPQNCLGDGMNLAVTSGVRISQLNDVSRLTNREKYEICCTSELQHEFQDLDGQRNKDFLTAYVGTSSGVLRSHPTINQLFSEEYSCQNYDPRDRPWFTASAVSGKKNVVLLLDLSASSTHTKDSIKILVDYYIQTLQRKDKLFFIVMKDDKADNFLASDYLQINETVKQTIIAKTSDITLSNKASNFTSGLQYAYQLLNKNIDNLCCKYENLYDIVFVLISGGNLTLSNESSLIETWIEFNIQFLIIEISTQKSEELTMLACSHNGTHLTVEHTASKQTIKFLMQSLYIFMAQGKQFQAPVWTEFYDDAFGFGRLNTVTLPVYYFKNQIGYFVGVAGIDVPMSKWVSLGGDAGEGDIIRELDTQLQYRIAEKNCQQNGTVQKVYENESQIITIQIVGEPLRQPETDQTQICCFSAGTLAGIVVGAVGITAIIVGLGIYCCLHRKPKSSLYSTSQQMPRIPQLPQQQIRYPQLYFPPPPPGYTHPIHPQQLNYPCYPVPPGFDANTEFNLENIYRGPSPFQIIPKPPDSIFEESLPPSQFSKTNL